MQTMRILRLTGWLLLTLTITTTAHPASAGERGRVVRVHIDSVTLHDRTRAVRVYLPPSYGSGNRRYPVVYMLHGWPGSEGNWPGSGRADRTLDSLIASKRIPEVIAVMPDGAGNGMLGRSLYLNSANGRMRVADFIVRELPAWVDSMYRTRPEPAMRAIMGLSDGGYAAINLAFQHPDVFGAAGSHSGYFRVHRDATNARVLGKDDHIMKENSPLDRLEELVPHLAGMPIYFDCGTGDGDLGSNRELDRRLTALAVPHTYHEFPGGHGWGYWRNHLHESLIAITARMR